MNSRLILLCILIIGIVTGCAGSASHEVISPHQATDENLSCTQIDAEIVRAQAVINAVLQDKQSISGADVVDTILWFPFNLAAKASNYQESLDAADRRIQRLQQLKEKKGCDGEAMMAQPAITMRLSEELKSLNDLYKSGALTAEEYKTAKQRVLSDPGRYAVQAKPGVSKPQAKIEAGLPEQAVFPRKLTSKEIRDHFRRYKVYTFDKVPRHPFVLTIRTFNNIERECDMCDRQTGTGSMNVRRTTDQVCFYWDNVRYPSSTCFNLFQLKDKSYRLVDPNDGETYEYSVPY